MCGRGSADETQTLYSISLQDLRESPVLTGLVSSVESRH